MYIRTDLATEAVNEDIIEGASVNVKKNDGFEITHITINESASKKINKAAGNYYTIYCEQKNKEKQVKALTNTLISLFPHGNALVIGLGNNDITPDSLGPKTVSDVLATRHLLLTARHFSNNSEHDQLSLREVTVIGTGVMGQTGMESSELVAAVVKQVNPAFVLAVDSLACGDISRMGTTIQITDTGISPGAGVQNKRKELSENTLGIPCIAVGVPTVIDLNSLTNGQIPDEKSSHMMVTPRDIDNVITHYSTVLSASINAALQPGLSRNEISSLLLK